MGWSTELFCNISFNKETFNHKSEVEYKIEEAKSYIQTVKEELRNLVMITEPKKFCPEDYDPLDWINQEYNELIDTIEEYTIKLYKLEKLLDNWDDCHTTDGLAIDYPDNMRKAYLWGDFIKSANE